MLTHPSRNNNIQFNTYNMKLVSSFNYFNCHYATDLRELIVLLLCRIFFSPARVHRGGVLVQIIVNPLLSFLFDKLSSFFFQTENKLE